MVKNVPIVPSAVAGSLAESKFAPSWREYRPEIIDQEKVNPLVVLFCPDGAVTIEERKTEVNFDLCKGCGICAAESGGIKMVPEYAGPKGIYGVKGVKK